MRAYSEMYLEDAMTNLGAMFDYCANDVGLPLEELYDRFISSGIANEFGKGNPCYVCGMSGSELMAAVIRQSGSESIDLPHRPTESLSAEYWAGWIIAYFQWYTSLSFKYLRENGLAISTVLSMYNPLHEADVSKFVEVALGHMESVRKSRPSPIKTLRKRLGLSQQECAELSGITLRMIRAYEQRTQDISKAEARTAFNLSKALRCPIEALF